MSTIDYKNRSRLENFKSNNPFNIDSNSAFLNDRFKSKSELGHKSSFIKNMESHVSIQSRISNEEERKKKYEAIKEKYCGASPTLDAESLRFKTNQEDILKNFQKLKKLKLKTLK